MVTRRLGFAALLVFALDVFAFGQNLGNQSPQEGGQRGQRGQRGPAAPAPPTPRRADGKVHWGPAAGQKGLWLPAAGGGERFVDPDNVKPRTPGRPIAAEVPFQPWAKEVYAYRNENQLEPHTRCKPSGGPRQFLTPYGVEFMDAVEHKKFYIFDLGGPHTYRTIHIDAQHPRDIVPSYYGHSIARWEGDTLVVDTIGFNEKFWFDRQGLPHTDKLHMIERFTRTDFNTVKYDVTIDDVGAYTRTWTSGFQLRWIPNDEMFEYICQDNNFASELMVGAGESIDRRSQIVP